MATSKGEGRSEGGADAWCPFGGPRPQEPDLSALRWDTYYQAVASRPPRELLRHVLMLLESEARAGMAVDLGCGGGIETEVLLARGWRVLAVDAREEAIVRLRDRLGNSTGSGSVDRLETRVAPFDALDLPACDLVWAGLSLPFCRPDELDGLWRRIVGALRPGGRFAGDFFGDRHGWSGRPGMTFHTKEQVHALCRPLVLEWFSEGEGLRPTALEGNRPWHSYDVIARKG